MFVQDTMKSIHALHFQHEKLQTILRFQGPQRLNGGVHSLKAEYKLPNKNEPYTLQLLPLIMELFLSSF